MKAFDYSLVKDPQYFCDNRMEAHSDHVYYRDGNEMQTAVQDGTETSFRYSQMCIRDRSKSAYSIILQQKCPVLCRAFFASALAISTSCCLPTPISLIKVLEDSSSPTIFKYLSARCV